jgi:hypothetical protein
MCVNWNAFVLISTTYDSDVAVRHHLMAYNRENNVLIKRVIVFAVSR